MSETEHRRLIIHAFARWAAAAATRQGCPVRGKALYPFLDAVPLDAVLSGDNPISETEFSIWHRRAVETLAETSLTGVGWAAKLVNLLLKVHAYVGSEGRPGLRGHLHPPSDNLLVNAIQNRYPLNGSAGASNRSLRRKTDKGAPIIGLTTYEMYLEVVDGLREIAEREGCLLCEVESLWPG